MRICKNCEKDISTLPRRATYCSNTCRRNTSSARSRERVRRRRTDRACVECGQPIPTDRQMKALTCSDICSRIRNRNGVIDKRISCIISGCDGYMHAQKGKYAGLCAAHAHRKRYGKDMTARVIRKKPVQGDCEFPECNRRVRAQGLCASHYEQKRLGLELRPILSRVEYRDVVPVGTKTHMEAGHIRVKTENGWRREHTLVMEEYIGRPLRSDELIHHKNGDRADNRIENLDLCVKRQPPTQRVKDQVAWARQILADYGDLVDRML